MADFGRCSPSIDEFRTKLVDSGPMFGVLCRCVCPQSIGWGSIFRPDFERIRLASSPEPANVARCTPISGQTSTRCGPHSLESRAKFGARRSPTRGNFGRTRPGVGQIRRHFGQLRHEIGQASAMPDGGTIFAPERLKQPHICRAMRPRCRTEWRPDVPSTLLLSIFQILGSSQKSRN